jgi:hypothetical protein
MSDEHFEVPYPTIQVTIVAASARFDAHSHRYVAIIIIARPKRC